MADRLVYVHVRALPLVMVVAIGDASVRLRGVMLKRPHVLWSTGDVARMHGSGADVVVRSLLANWAYPIVREALQYSVQGAAATQVLALRAVIMSRLGVRVSEDVPDPENAWMIVRALFGMRSDKSVN